eukprot:Rmarinus@m.27287
MTQEEAQYQLAQGLGKLLRPAVEECDARIHAVTVSQYDLAKQIDSLSAELERLMSIAQDNAGGRALLPYVEKLASARKRIATVNSLILGTQARVDRLHKVVPALSTASPVAPPPSSSASRRKPKDPASPDAGDSRAANADPTAVPET